MKLTKKFIEKVKRNGIYETEKYRYIYIQSTVSHRIERLPKYLLGTTAEWEKMELPV